MEQGLTGRGARITLLSLLVMGVVLSGCDGGGVQVGPEEQEDLRERFGLEALGEIPYPADNLPRPERIELGRLLFYDPILSGEKDVSCGTCHHPDFAFADGRQFGAGVSGVGLGPARTVSQSAITGNPITLEPRNSPTVFNTAYNGDEMGRITHEGFQFHDGRVRGLEEQALKPITSRVEMRGDAYPGTDEAAAAAALDSVLTRLRAIPGYVRRFEEAFPQAADEVEAGQRTSVIDSSTYSRAIAAFERELVTRNAPYDQYVRGDDEALSDVQKKGLELFFTKAKCAVCHDGPMFSDFRFVVQGVPQEGVGKDVFRTLTLRNVELTPPYMHDGVFETLEDVVRFYNRGAQPRHPEVSDDMLDPVLVDPLRLTEDEIAALVAFMNALTDPGTALPDFLLAVPEQVPSGLPPVFGVKGSGGTELVRSR